uniref:HAD-superfamily phosphatase, subfamily IIIC/FkbH-like domain-containing protein/thioester reductase domain-containing protein n=2 Tax=Candidatus Kentrum sp. FW TaxID=2126338 RepID=A0A450SB54_9GAMM|nr:MAG: HAD-superfamily phosphatase, subfamily IIIC/FkbH-like domain-containing protein/thioester reductase domain-containing protein [Candidatus Kentron sp. FW]
MTVKMMNKNILQQPTTLVELLRRRAKTQSDKTAYTFLKNGETEEASLTYGRLDEQARAIAVRLREITSPGERALLLYHAGLDFICAFFGCLYAGVIAVPTYPPRHNRTDARFAAIALDAQASVVLTTAEILSGLDARLTETPQLKNIHWLATDDLDTEAASNWQMPDIDGDTLAFLQYTSGSTGTPKGVMISHGNLLYNEEMIYRGFGHTEETIGVGWLPLFHDMGLIGNVLQPLYLPFPIILMSPVAFLQKPVRWLRTISGYKATTSGGPNFAYDLCVEKITPEQKAGLDLSSWEVAFNGAEPIRAETLKRFTEVFSSCGFRREAFYPTYGMAETTLFVSGGLKTAAPVVFDIEKDAIEQHRVVAAPDREGGRKMVGCGRSLLDQKIIIAHPEALHQCPDRQVGEIWVSGGNVAQGYWGQSEETKETFRAHLADTGEGPFLRTGDLGFLKDGELFVTGRLKDLIIIHGQNHYPQDIELTVERAVGFVKANGCAAASITVEGEERLVIAMEANRELTRKIKAVRKQQAPSPNEHNEQSAKAREELDRTVANLAHRVRETVAREHEISLYALAFVKPGEFPRTSSGKVQRRACRTLFLERKDEVACFWYEAGRMGKGAQRRAHHPSSGSMGPMSPMSPMGLESVGSEMGTSLRDFAHPTAAITSWLTAKIAKLAGIPPEQIDTDHPFAHYGLDSVAAAGLSGELGDWLGKPLPATVVYEYPTIDALARHVAGMPGSDILREGERTPSHPLSHGQQALWFLHRNAPESPAYSVGMVFRILSSIDVSTPRAVFQTLLHRHPSLRSTFSHQDGQPVQIVHDHQDVHFEEIDAAMLTEEALHRQVTESYRRPFDLEQGPLFRVGLFTRAPEEHVLLLTLHHIITDGWSMWQLLSEFFTLYSARKTGQEAVLPLLRWQYPDFVRWQTELLAGAEGERLWQYWREQLAGELPVLDLPTDRPRPPVQSNNGASITFTLPEALTRKLKEQAQASDATLYTILLAAFQVLLHRYTSQEDILVGSPATGRGHPVFKDIFGYFANPIALRARFEGDPTFSTFLNQVRQTVLGGLAHQDYPFPVLVERLQPVRDASFSPIFQVFFALQKPQQNADLFGFLMGENDEKASIEYGGLTLAPFSLAIQTEQFDLALEMIEGNQSLSGALKYNTDLFDAETIVDMVENFRALLEGIADDPVQRVSGLPLSRGVPQPAVCKRMRFHHNGIACRSMEEGIGYIREIYDVTRISDVVFDKYQDASVCLVETSHGIDMELVAGNRVQSLIDRGIGLYHVCYEVSDLPRAMEEMMAKGASVVAEPKPAPLFDNRLVTFLHTDAGLVELLEETRSISAEELAQYHSKSAPKIAIAATFTAEPIKDSLDFWMAELALPFEVTFAPYNQVFQQLLDPDSLMAGNRTGIDVLLVRLQDWGKPEAGTIDTDEVARNVRQFAAALQSAPGETCMVCICPAPPETVHGGFYRQMEEWLGSELEGTGNVHFVGSEAWRKTYPVARFDDPHGEEIGHVPYTPPFFAALGTTIARRIHAILRAPHKVIVLDCDNTLWQGVCAEDGVAGIRVDAPHLALQRFVIARQQAGKLLCLCSKNRESDVLTVFDGRSDMLLQREHLAAWRIDWRPKSENIRALAGELNLGLSSFIFMDDNPIECAEVQTHCPEVTTVQLPTDPERWKRFLDHIWAFDSLQTTVEDQRRTRYYQQDRQRHAWRQDAPTFGDFLAGLELEVTISSMTPARIGRVSQLTQRTNQFNCTTIRRTVAEIERLYESGVLECLVVEVKDRFGDYGLVGVMLFELAAETLRVDTFLLSCRALGRGVEHRMLARLGEIARERDCDSVDIPCIPSEKNQPARDFLEAVGGQFQQATAQGWRFHFPADAVSGLRYTSIEEASVSVQESSTEPQKDTGTGIRAESELFNRIATELHGAEAILARIDASKKRQYTGKFAAPETPDEEKLSAIWAQILGLEKVGIHDNFFKLGGYSLLIVRIMSRIQETFSVALPLHAMFESPTVAGLARVIEAARRGEGGDAVTEETAIDFYAEATLEPTIQPPAGTEPATKPHAIFLTGATGFLGAYLLHELLVQTTANIHCLVRARDTTEAKRRLRDKLESYAIWDERFADRIIPVMGELSRPLLGLPEADFHRLAGEIDTIYHNGAMVNFTYPYSELKAANVLGTQEVLRLACRDRTKPVHFTSTVAVFPVDNPGVVNESEMGDIQRIEDGYAQSKWVAERLVRQARDRGLPVCIYRPSRISWHTRTGCIHTDDLLNRAITGSIGLGKIPDKKFLDNMVPVDYVSHAMVHLSRQTGSWGKTFHLVNPQPTDWDEIFDRFRAQGCRLQRIPYTKWREELANNEENALFPLLPMFHQPRFSDDEPVISPRFDDRNTLEGLADTDIICPVINFDVYFSYLRNSGLL